MIRKKDIVDVRGICMSTSNADSRLVLKKIDILVQYAVPIGYNHRSAVELLYTMEYSPSDYPHVREPIKVRKYTCYLHSVISI